MSEQGNVEKTAGQSATLQSPNGNPALEDIKNNDRIFVKVAYNF